MIRVFAIFALIFAAAPAAAAPWPTSEGDFVIHDFHFKSGEALPELRIHYTTLGTPHRDAKGEIDNAVMVLHGTGGSGKNFLVPQFADELYAPGQPFDITRMYVILPDNIGHGGSSRPATGCAWPSRTMITATWSRPNVGCWSIISGSITSR